jgi:pimeloyl-ACP methyl ester carboxylesterase
VTGDAVERFRVHVDDAVLDDLRRRLELTRFPDAIAGTGWDYGASIDEIQELVSYWREQYNWRAEEARLDELDQFVTRIDGQELHFVHVRSPEPDALPLLLVHGWPGSFVEFLDVIPMLTADGFDVVVPSLPGYAFSEPPRTPGWDVRRIAAMFVELMARLGYSRYGAQGGDWGAQITTRMATLDREHCVGLHLNMPIASAPDDAPLLTEEEQADLAAMARFQREHAAYAQLQGTQPQTLGIALDDSPSGLMAWIVQRFRDWSDCDGQVLSSFSRDQLLTNVMLYWVTRSFASSARLYWETMHSGALQGPFEHVDVPTGIARYPKEEILRFPRSWVEARYHVTHWAEMPRGGHFAAMEEPELFADDVVAFFQTLRK